MKDKNMSLPDKIQKLKQLINTKAQENKELISKANRLKFESEKMFALTKKAKDTVVPVKSIKPPPSKEANIFAEFGSGPLSTGETEGSGKHTAKYHICTCGDPNPTMKGYCVECVKKLKAKFDKCLVKFNKIKDEYDGFNQ